MNDMLREYLLSFLSKLPTEQLSAMYFAARTAPWNKETPTVVATKEVRKAKRSKKKVSNMSSSEDSETSATKLNKTSQSPIRVGSFTHLVAEALTPSPMKAADVTTKLFESKLIPAVDAKMKARVAVTLGALARRKAILKTGSAYSRVL